MSAPAIAPRAAGLPRRGHLVLVVSNDHPEEASYHRAAQIDAVARRRALRNTALLLLAMVAAVIIGAWWGAEQRHAQLPEATAVVQVAAGDTLWGIASGLAQPHEDVRELIYQIQELNGLASSELAAGQRLVVPQP